jgi:hypothetical protein
MSWIKRNLYFLLCTLVAFGLMVWGGFFLFSAVSGETEITGKIAERYDTLKKLYEMNPNPGSGDVDNVKEARDQNAELKAYIKQAGAFFRSPPPVPDEPKVVNADFAAQLRNTVAELTRGADEDSVQIPHDYYFTFEAQRHLMLFDPASLNKLAARLGEIKVICNILFKAKVNALDGVRREVVSAIDDKNMPDYLSAVTTVTPLVEMTPYEVTFRCFSTELADVLGGLANSPYCFIVKTINVEPAAAALAPGGTANVNPPEPGLNPRQYVLSSTPDAPLLAHPPEAGPGARPEYPTYGANPPPYGANPPPLNPSAAGRAPGTLLNEKQLRITLMIEVVKLKPGK